MKKTIFILMLAGLTANVEVTNASGTTKESSEKRNERLKKIDSCSSLLQELRFRRVNVEEDYKSIKENKKKARAGIHKCYNQKNSWDPRIWLLTTNEEKTKNEKELNQHRDNYSELKNKKTLYKIGIKIIKKKENSINKESTSYEYAKKQLTKLAAILNKTTFWENKKNANGKEEYIWVEAAEKSLSYDIIYSAFVKVGLDQFRAHKYTRKLVIKLITKKEGYYTEDINAEYHWNNPAN